MFRVYALDKQFVSYTNDLKLTGLVRGDLITLPQMTQIISYLLLKVNINVCLVNMKTSAFYKRRKSGNTNHFDSHELNAIWKFESMTLTWHKVVAARTVRSWGESCLESKKVSTLYNVVFHSRSSLHIKIWLLPGK